ncbi:hypothetical protein CONLIGDRAFT_685074 [Coniochaeta ligniaria NRRL 30616]|uniref:Uncharacterized protein n=1 Tax=Coniochaeta ligniaria NRRL 30616 TaxID=1408157 RepID=A0A1J7ICQ6_9PEZI|nr:hypothetical protein CONLIGDRAFT_685074 [Coniochaeta ligniaria NRRL 30616]
MATSQDTIPQSWRFTSTLTYVLVDGKQIANGVIDLVVKCHAGKSPASASRHVEQPTPNRHTLMVYVPNEANPTISLSLDGFLAPTATVPDPPSFRYSAQRRRLLINGSSRLESQHPVHDLRFSKGRDLLDAVSRLNRIGIICADDDNKDTAAAAESQSSTGSRSQTTSPAFVLSAEMMKAGRVKSPLERRPDGSTPPFCLIQVPKSKRSTPSQSTQESTSSQLSQESQLMLPPRRELNFTSKPASVPVSAQRERSEAQLESIPPVLPLRDSTSTISSIPERAPGPVSRNGRASRRPAGGGKLQRVDSIADTDISSSQPAKRPRVSQASRHKDGSQAETASEIPDSQESLAQIQDTNHRVDTFGQRFETHSIGQPESTVPDAQILVDQQNELNAAMADQFWRGNMQQTMIWEELRDALTIDVDAAEDDDEALESLVEKYQMDLSVRIGRDMSYL